MNLAIHHDSCKSLNIIDFVKKARNFQGLELTYENLDESLSEKLKLKDIFEYMEIYDLELVSIQGLGDFSLSSKREFNLKTIPTLQKMMQYCYKLECYLITITPSMESRDIPQWRITRRTIRRLKELAKIAYEEDIKIGFEFINEENSSISSLLEAKEVLEALKTQENVGYIVDTFYLAKSDENIEDLSDIVNFLYLIRLADIKMSVKDEKNYESEFQRTFIGEGEFEFKQFFEKIRRFGYRSYYSIRINNELCKDNLFKKFLNYILRNQIQI